MEKTTGPSEFLTFTAVVDGKGSNRDSERSGSSTGSIFLDVRTGGALERQITFREFCSLVKQTPGKKAASTGGDSGRGSSEESRI